MTFPLFGAYKWGAGWDQPRPLVGPKTHVHGAVDFPVPEAVRVLAPEEGDAIAAVIFREDGPPADIRYHGFWFPFSNYAFRVYGAIIALFGSRYTHLFAHLAPEWFPDVFQVDPHVTHHGGGPGGAYTMSVIWGPVEFREGEVLAKVGLTGGIEPPLPSTEGRHLHYELHNPGVVWTPYDKRPRPEEVYQAEYNTRRG